MDPTENIWKARAALLTARRFAQQAWNQYVREENERFPDEDRAENRCAAATRMPEDILELLGLDSGGA